jgi:hypothetical protein
VWIPSAPAAVDVVDGGAVALAGVVVVVVAVVDGELEHAASTTHVTPAAVTITDLRRTPHLPLRPPPVQRPSVSEV